MTKPPVKILVIEDEEDVLTYLTAILEEGGYTVRGCRDSREGMEEVQKFRPDLICLDVMMPRETGLSFYINLRHRPENLTTPVIIISGAIHEKEFNFRTLVPDITIPPPNCYLEKPITAEELLATVRRLTSPASAANDKR